MPRLTNQRYLAQRAWLLALFEPSSRFRFTAKPSISDQQTVVDFYGLTSHRTDQQALEHRRKVAMADPSLPSRAGKALRRLEAVLVPVPKHGSHASRGGRVYVASDERYDPPNVALLADAIIRIVEQLDRSEDGMSSTGSERDVA